MRKKENCRRGGIPKSECRTRCLSAWAGGCIASGSERLREALARELAGQNAERRAVVKSTGCLGPCVRGPVLVIEPDGIRSTSMSPLANAGQIVSSHIIGTRPVERLLNKNSATGAINEKLGDVEFFKRQTKIVLANCGLIDPLSIEDYIGREGYAGLAKGLFAMKPDEVIDEMKKSGLRGPRRRGFFTGLKWSFTRRSPGECQVCSLQCGRGRPRCIHGQSVLEGDPHSVIEGMAVAAYAVGAQKGYVYVRAEYPLCGRAPRYCHCAGE